MLLLRMVTKAKAPPATSMVPKQAGTGCPHEATQSPKLRPYISKTPRP